MRPLLTLLTSLGLLFGLSAAVFAQKGDTEADLEKRVFEKDKVKLPYRLMKPDGYKADDKHEFPLVVFLHGAGERGDDNKLQLKHGVSEFAKADARKKHPCFLIAPQCPAKENWVANSGTVLALIEALEKEFRIDKKRIYVTGLSMGGHGTWDLLCHSPETFAAGIPICGGNDPKKADKLVKVPIWCFCGDKDKGPVERSREMIEAIKKAGGEPKYTEYPGVGHDSWTQTYRDPKVHDWLFAQKRP
jgi:predicted peptidase